MTHPYAQAGGNSELLSILERVGTVRPFVSADGRAVAGFVEQRRTRGAIWDWVGDDDARLQAEAWLREQGCTEVRGPHMLASWFPSRANLGPHATPPLAFEPMVEPERWEAAGYEPIARYVTVVAEHEKQINMGRNKAAALASMGWSLEPLGPISLASFDEALTVVHRLFSAAFADVEGYVDAPLSAVADFYRPFRHLIEPELTLFARTPEGEIVGTILVIDAGQPTTRWFQVATLAVAPRYRRLGVAAWLVAAAHQKARNLGFSAGVHSMVRLPEGPEDGNGWVTDKVIRRYALFSKSLQR